jgi:NAD-dependent protein deacetylase sirtuin 5
VPALIIPDDVDISDESTHLPDINIADLPTCPKCRSLLRPNVMLFGEEIGKGSLDRIDKFVAEGDLDLMLVVGTCAAVYPAASYVQKARAARARIAYVDIAPWSEDSAPLPESDWYFQGDVVDVIPRLLKGVLQENVESTCEAA